MKPFPILLYPWNYYTKNKVSLSVRKTILYLMTPTNYLHMKYTENNI